ncbi:ATP synthase F0 subunit 8 (mitochondrion) [Phyllobates terribilis]|uniref:ATP synthase complex subunit 8 n=1 Tax=Phyllobates terribilis TaxID=111132 RepID=A0A343J6E4_PHYTE|nr:ATP synthase F0 subunit 8 [Phyllobates terribilis]ASV64515.1 ATP synthase F0 subunit 8 [Phyllobates terribilis]
MPQLDPSPWFFILLSSWMIFLLFSPTKISKHYFINDPNSKTSKGLNKSWSWPWP